MLYPPSEVTTLVAGLDHPEGIAVARDGTIFVGSEAGQIYRISGDGAVVETIANTGGFCLGITLDRQENIYVCDKGNQQILQVTQSGHVDLVASSAAGRDLICPNFSVFDSLGNLYFSDSGKWKQRNGFIGRVSPDGRTEIFAHGPFHFPNGLALDAQQRFLYVVESNLDRVIRLPIRYDGTSGSPEIYADKVGRIPDGLAFDADGNLYVTTYASNSIYRVSPERQIALLCADDECAVLCQVTNCAFGGPHFDQLLIANLGASHLSRLPLGVKGQLLWHHSG